MEPTPHAVPRETGWIEVIAGCMFSGKTEELIRRLRRAKIAKQKVVIFKPNIDTRYSTNAIVSHSEQSLPSILIKDVKEILDLVEDAQVIGIDEAQFFDDELPSVCQVLANRGIRVLVAGLDMDYLGKPFGPIPTLLSIAEYVTKVHAICMKCGELANYSHRTVAVENRILLGEQESYVPLCRHCFNQERKEHN